MNHCFLALVLSLVILTGCATPPPQPIYETMAGKWREIPVRANLQIIGEWNVPSDEPSNYFKHSTVSIVRDGDLHLLVGTSAISTGCCSGTHGVILKLKEGVFSESYFQRSYEIQSDGTLVIRSPVQPDQNLSPTSPEDSLSAKWP